MWGSERGRVEPGENLGFDVVATETTADLKVCSGTGMALYLKLGHAIGSLYADTAFIACRLPLGWSMTLARTFPREQLCSAPSAADRPKS